MSRRVYYESEGEEKKLVNVKNVEDNGMFFRVEYSSVFTDGTKTTNIRKDKVIRYDE